MASRDGKRTIQIIGNATSAKEALHQTAAAAETTGSKIRKAFGPVSTVFSDLPFMQGPIGSMLSNLGTQFDAIGGHLDGIKKKGDWGRKIGDGFAAAGVGVAGLGVGLEELAGPLEKAQAQLETSIKNAGGSFDDYKGKIAAADSAMQNYGIRSQDTDQALATLTTSMHSPQKALKYLGETADIAAARHISLNDAASMVARLAAGSGTRALTAFGIASASVSTQATKGTKAHIDFEKAMKALAERTKGQAQASVDSFGGRLDVLKVKVLDGAAQLGQKYGPALMGIGAAMTIAGSAASAGATLIKTIGKSAEAASAGADVLAASEDGMAGSEAAADAAGAPLAVTLGIIVLAVAAVGLAVYEVIKHWSGITHFFKTVWQDVVKLFHEAIHGIVDIIKGWWPLILGIMTGGIGLLPALLVKYWSQIKSDVVSYWNDVVSWFEGIPGDLLNVLKGAGTWLVNVGKDVIHGLAEGLVDAAQAMFGHIPFIGGKLVGLFKDVLGVHSPSVVFAGIGHNLMQGLEQGIRGSAHLPGTALGQVASSLAATPMGFSGRSNLASGSPAAQVAPISPTGGRRGVHIEHLEINTHSNASSQEIAKDFAYQVMRLR